jgi:hypothetical protein
VGEQQKLNSPKESGLTASGHTPRKPWNIHFNLDKEREDHKISRVYVWWCTCGMGRANEEDEGCGIWWRDFICFYERQKRNLLELL